MSNRRKTTRRWSAKARRRVAERRAEWRNSVYGRLDADGASKVSNIRRRLSWLVQEWQLPTLPPIGRNPSQALADYCKEHSISLDWMLCGDLKGFQRMTQWRREGKAAATPDSLRAKLARLSDSERDLVRKIVDQIVEGAS